MRKLFYLSLLSLALVACANADGNKHPTEPGEPVNRFLSQQDKENHLYQDTITPPSNPLVPPTEETYTTRGVLVAAWLNWNINRPAVRTIHSQTDFYLLESSHQFAYFCDPLLAGLQTGDTIAVTGETCSLSFMNARYGIYMTEIQLLGTYNPHHADEDLIPDPSDEEEKGGDE